MTAPDHLAAAAGGSTVDALFRRAFSVYADRIAVTSEQVRLTYRDVGERSRRLAAAFAGLGIGRGDRIAVLSETRPEYVETYAAVARLGITLVALNIRMHPAELADCIERSRPVALIVSSALSAPAEAMPGPLPTLRHRICFDDAPGYSSYTELLDQSSGEPPAVDVGPADIHNVLFTSGTTGRPKAAMISQSAAAVRGLRLAQWFGLSPEDGFVGWLPLFHCGADESLYATMLTGGTYATFAKADVTTMFRLIERDRLSWTLLLPGVLTDYLDHPARGEHDLSSMRFAIGYANMMPRTIQRLTTECGIDFSDAFGQTETSYLLANGWCRPGEPPSLRKLPTPLLEVRIVDSAGNEVPDGTPGECVVRGPSVMSGYLNEPEATAAAFAGGWLHTGDMLRREPDGTLSFVDRTKYLIKTGGENVYPAEVELVLAEHTAVRESCVLGVPDARWGETVVAVVVLAPGATCTGAELATWCRSRLAGFKCPRYVRFVAPEALPRSTTGKIQRHELASLGVREEERV